MTILWCGGEDVDFPNGNTPTLGTTWAYNSSHSRGYISAWAKTEPCWSTSFMGGGVTSCWFGFFMAVAYNTINNRIVGIIDSSTGSSVKGIYVGTSAYSGTAYKMALYKWDGINLTTIASESGYSFPSGSIVCDSIHKIDLQIVDYGSSAVLRLYYEGSLVIEYNGDISITGVSSLNAIGILSPADVYIALSEFFVADEDTRLMRLKTLAPSAAGDTSTNWTGAYTDIDEVTLSDTDRIYSSTADADFQANLTGMPTGTYSVKAVKVAARAVDGSGSLGMALGVKTGGTVNVGATETCIGYWQTKERLMTINPVSGVAWTPADIEALQLNIRAKAV